MGDPGEGSGPVLARRRFLQAAGVASLVGTFGAGPAVGETTYTTTDYTIDADDGTTLATTLYVPDESGAFPAVLMTHGWGMNRSVGMVTRKAETYASNGYVVLTYDSRGFGASGGDVGLDGPNEVADVSRLIDWLAGREAVATEDGDPVLGMDGGSYAGGIQLHAAAEDDRIDAIVPRITWHDLNYALAPHGVVKVGWQTILNSLGQLTAWDTDGRTYSVPLWEWYFESVVDNEVSAEASEAFAERSIDGMLDQLDVPTLLVQGWDDTLFKTTEALDTYEGLRENGVETSVVFYEGGHAPEMISVSDSEHEYMNGLALDWMDRHLKGESTSVPETAYYLKQAEDWREDSTFPPSDAGDTTFSTAAVTSDDYTELEENIWWWDGTYRDFEWTVDTDLELVGEPEIDLWVYPDGSEARLFFELYHEHDGYLTKINDVAEAYRVEGGDQWHNVTFDFPALQRYVAAGDTVRLRVSITNPFHLDSRADAPVYVGHDGDHPTSFTVPTREQAGPVERSLDLASGDRVHAAVNDTPIYEYPDYDHITDKVIYSSGHVIDGPETEDGSTWWQVRWWEDDEGVDGWVREEYLERGEMNSERLSPGDRIEVDMGFYDLPIRDGPGLSYTEVDEADDGDQGRIVDGPEWNPDDDTHYVWWKVDYDDGNETGWCAQDGMERL